MKNNMILILAAIIAMFTLAVALYGASATLLGQAPAAEADNGSVHTAPADSGDNLTLAGDTGTALGALAATSADPTVKSWMDRKKVVYVASISSDFCQAGLSDTWAVTYVSDDGQITAHVVQGKVVDARLSSTSPQQGFDPARAIDSPEIWEVVSMAAVSPGEEMPQTAAMVLKVIDGKSRWDVSYEAADGLHVVRVDAMNGTVTDQVTIGR